MTSCPSCSLLQRLLCFLTGCEEFDSACSRIDDELDRFERNRKAREGMQVEIRKLREEIEAMIRAREAQ